MLLLPGTQHIVATGVKELPSMHNFVCRPPRELGRPDLADSAFSVPFPPFSPGLYLLGNHIGRAVSPAEHGIGLGVAGEFFVLAHEFQFAADTIRDIGQVRESR